MLANEPLSCCPFLFLFQCVILYCNVLFATSYERKRRQSMSQQPSDESMLSSQMADCIQPRSGKEPPWLEPRGGIAACASTHSLPLLSPNFTDISIDNYCEKLYDAPHETDHHRQAQ